MLLYEKTGCYETLQLEIFGGYYTLEDIYIHQKINEHTIMRLTAVVSEESAMIYEQELLSNRGLRLIQKQGEEELVLFGGMIQNLIVERKNGIYYIHVEGASFTKYIDIRKENVSYQNENSTYKEVIDKALEKYHFSGIPYLWTEKSRFNPVNRFLLQFKETDWEFIKRVASIEHLGLIPDMTGRHTQFFIGLPKGREERAVPPCKHTVQRHLQKAEKEVRNGSVGKDIYPGDYLQYILHDITAHYELGDVVRFQDVSYIVVEKTSTLKKEEGILWNTYVVQQKKGISFPRLYNNALRGNSLTGTVIDVKRNFTKLHLHIDKQQQEVATACWFPQPQYFTAGSDSGFCIMPERGDMMRLHFPTKDEAEHYIICSDNGDFDKLLFSINTSKGGKEPEKTAKASNSNAPYEKYLTTPEGKGMLLNDSVVKYHTTGDISTIQMEDGKGIVISSEGNIEMLSNNIYLNYGYTESGPMPAKSEKVNLWAGKKIEITCGSSSIIIDGEGKRQDWKALDIYLRSPLNKPVAMLTNDACDMLLSALEESRQAEIPRFTPDGIKITNDNKYQTAILEYLESWYDENWRPMQQLLKDKENFINVLKINHPELYEKLLNENPDFYEELCDIYSVERPAERRLQGPGKLYSDVLGYEKPQKLKDLEALAEVREWTKTYYGLSEMEWRTGTLDGATTTLGQLASLVMLAYTAYSIVTSTASSVNTYSSVNQMQKTVTTGRMAVSKSGDIGYIMQRPKTWLSPARNNMVVYTSTNEIVAYIEKRNGQAQLLLFTSKGMLTRTIDKLVMTSGANAASQSVLNQQGLLMGAAGQNLLTNTNSPALPQTNLSRLPMQSVMVRQSIESIFRSTALPVVQEQFVKAVMGEEFPYFISVPGTQQTVLPVQNVLANTNSEIKINNQPTIVKETDKFVDYLNPAGKTIRISKQPNKTILDSISRNLNNEKDGKDIEAKVADFINKNTSEQVIGFGNVVRDPTNNGTIGDIDCVTENIFIEVKKSISSVKMEQLDKYIDITNEKYINVYNKKVILYIDEKIDLKKINNERKVKEIENKLKEIKDKGVIVVNGLEELGKEIQ